MFEMVKKLIKNRKFEIIGGLLGLLGGFLYWEICWLCFRYLPHSGQLVHNGALRFTFWCADRRDV